MKKKPRSLLIYLITPDEYSRTVPHSGQRKRVALRAR
jgi:hypothetical protein